MTENLIEDGLKKINRKIESIQTNNITQIEKTITQEINTYTPLFESINQKINNIPPKNYLKIQIENIDLQEEHINLISEFIDEEMLNEKKEK